MGTRVLLPALAVFGGWLMVLPGSVVTLALRFESLDPASSSTRYSLTLAAGWLVLIVSLIACGRLGDTTRARGGSRAVVARWSLPIATACTLLFATAQTPTTLSAAWIALQAPAGAIIATGLGLAGERAPAERRGLASGLMGLAPLLALLLGTLAVRVMDPDVALAAGLIGMLAILAAVPICVHRGALRTAAGEASANPNPNPNPDGVQPGPEEVRRRRMARAWVLFLMAGFCLSWSTSIGNSYVVLVVENLVTMPGSAVAVAASQVVALASVTAIAFALIGGLISRRGQRGTLVFGIGTLIVGVASVVTMSATTQAGLIVAGLLYGIGFGVANGAELAVALWLRGRGMARSIGADLGLLNAVTSLPYVLAPVVAALLLADAVESGLRALYLLSACLAGVGVVMVALAGRAQERTGLPTSLTSP